MAILRRVFVKSGGLALLIVGLGAFAAARAIPALADHPILGREGSAVPTPKPACRDAVALVSGTDLTPDDPSLRDYVDIYLRIGLTKEMADWLKKSAPATATMPHIKDSLRAALRSAGQDTPDHLPLVDSFDIMPTHINGIKIPNLPIGIDYTVGGSGGYAVGRASAGGPVVQHFAEIHLRILLSKDSTLEAFDDSLSAGKLDEAKKILKRQLISNFGSNATNLRPDTDLVNALTCRR